MNRDMKLVKHGNITIGYYLAVEETGLYRIEVFNGEENISNKVAEKLGGRKVADMGIGVYADMLPFGNIDFYLRALAEDLAKEFGTQRSVK